VYIQCFDCCLVSTFTMKPRFHHLLLAWCDWEIHSHRCCINVKKSKLNPFSAFCAHSWAYLEPCSILLRTCDSLA
jgi:hypothetical protein